MKPEIRYARSGDVHIAYQVIGEGPIDMLFVGPWVSNIELYWEEPGLDHSLERAASFCRLIMMDKRGTGNSDRRISFGGQDEQMDDVRAVLDAVGSKRAVLYGSSEGSSLMAVFAAAHPERVSALALYGTVAASRPTPETP